MYTTRARAGRIDPHYRIMLVVWPIVLTHLAQLFQIGKVLMYNSLQIKILGLSLNIINKTNIQKILLDFKKTKNQMKKTMKLLIIFPKFSAINLPFQVLCSSSSPQNPNKKPLTTPADSAETSTFQKKTTPTISKTSSVPKSGTL